MGCKEDIRNEWDSRIIGNGTKYSGFKRNGFAYICSSAVIINVVTGVGIITVNLTTLLTTIAAIA